MRCRLGRIHWHRHPIKRLMSLLKSGVQPFSIALAAWNVTAGATLRTMMSLHTMRSALSHRGFTVANSEQLGMAGTLLQNIQPDPGASLRVLLDRNLRESAIAANRANPNLQRSNVDGSRHNYWVDAEAGFNTQDQTDLIQFLLSLDDNPEVLPTSAR